VNGKKGITPASATAGAGLSILLVDDDDAFRERMARALRERGFAVTTAPDRQAALAAAAQLPDFAVVDMRMPDGSGQEVVEGLADVSPHTRSVILTGYGSIASAVEALHKGAVHYLSKPIDADELAATILKLDGEEDAASVVDVTPSLARAEWEHIQRVLTDCGGNVSEAARRLGIARRTLQLKLKKDPPRV
jgi:two-component system response regulator RegA